MTDDLNRLRAVAEAATPGPWQSTYLDEGIAEIENVDGGHVAVCDGKPVDAEHIATFDPPTVLALLDRAERAETERDELRAELDAWMALLSDEELERLRSLLAAAPTETEGENA